MTSTEPHTTGAGSQQRGSCDREPAFGPVPVGPAGAPGTLPLPEAVCTGQRQCSSAVRPKSSWPACAGSIRTAKQRSEAQAHIQRRHRGCGQFVAEPSGPYCWPSRHNRAGTIAGGTYWRTLWRWRRAPGPASPGPQACRPRSITEQNLERHRLGYGRRSGKRRETPAAGFFPVERASGPGPPYWPAEPALGASQKENGPLADAAVCHQTQDVVPPFSVRPPELPQLPEGPRKRSSVVRCPNQRRPP